MDTAALRQNMVARHIRARGVRDPRVLQAMNTVPREALLPAELAEFAYDDTPLPIAAGQTISQPYIVALMADAARLRPGDKVLEIGTGSGYGAAVLAELAAEVFTIERHPELAEAAGRRLAELGYANITVRCGDGTLGWAEHGPFHAIVVTAGGPDVPRSLLDQLVVGGRLIIPVGESRRQDLVRVTRIGPREFEREDLGPVQFVPLIGAEGWAEPAAARSAGDHAAEPSSPSPARPVRAVRPGSRPEQVSRLVAECARPIDRIDDADLASLLDRVGDARVVLLGEATHGTSEFYRMRARITQELILRKGFRQVAVEADWPDAAAIDQYVRHGQPRPKTWVPFARFPRWMWRNQEVRDLVEWLRLYNAEAKAPSAQVGFAGLDLYSLFTSAYEVVRYLDRVDPDAARIARERYGCLTPWQSDPAIYGRMALSGRYRMCEREVVAMLRDLLARRLDYAAKDGDRYLDATQNARVVAGAERYYRAMYYGGAASWNLRDQHMFDTLKALLDHGGPDARIVVWEHNSHVGDASATEMGARGEHNVGQLCRTAFGDEAYLVGFGTDRGTVAAAHDWDGPMSVMSVVPSHPDSYERICRDAGVPAFFLPLRHPTRDALRDELLEPRLERAIGVIYRPETELASHYFQAVLPAQFDEWIWFDETSAVTPLDPEAPGLPEPHPLAA
jgi:protein-L-isoaspartate(D-aspartate) O-methyltransferase